ncbi:MAG: homoserine dehydrogenase [Flavobacteriales bacterium]|nr:homoserine dehydrogenase [Flavobacteriales bacterium]
MSKTPLTIGTFGNGCVGQGFLELLNAHRGTAAHVKHVCVKDRERSREIGSARLTYEALDILTDDQVSTVVELTNDPDLALDVIRKALLSGRNVITASKKVVAENLGELIALQRSTGRALLYEASCAASIPVLNALETHFSGERVERIEGILNGTTNCILTQVEEGRSPQEALRLAQQNGFAESDPTSDLRGDDARYKLTILLAHAFGTVVKPSLIHRFGIQHVNKDDLDYARAAGWTIRSIARAELTNGTITAHVLPTFVPREDAFAHVRNEYNAVRIVGTHSGEHVLQGKGAGRLPTGLAVLSDVQRLVQGGAYAYEKVNEHAPGSNLSGKRLNIYLRLPVTHQEVLARFDTVKTVGLNDTSLQVEGMIALEELAGIIGEGRDGFQVIALPHLRAANSIGGE